MAPAAPPPPAPPAPPASTAPDRRWGSAPLLLALLLVLALAGVAFLDGIRSRPITLWDESRLAVNAAEMVASGNWLVTTYEGRPDLWNTKPPLLVWLQAALLRLGLPGAVAVRLPSALAATACAVGLLLVGHRMLRDTLAGAVAALVLVGSPGFAGVHVARSGDYDALLALLVGATLVAFFAWSESDDDARRRRWLAAFWLLLLAALLTKSVHALIGLPALLLHAALTGRLRRLLLARGMYLGLAATAGAVALFVLLRERAAPGYLDAMLANDVLGRYLDTVERHAAPAGYYLRGFVDGRFAPWILLLPAAAAATLAGRRDRGWRLSLLALLFALTALLVLETARTKIHWYDAQLYPPLALVVGVGVARVVHRLLDRRAASPGAVLPARAAGREALAAASFLVLPLAINLRAPGRDIVSGYAVTDDPRLRYGGLFAALRERTPAPLRLQVVDDGFLEGARYNAPLRFHVVLANARGDSLVVVAPDSLRPMLPVASCDSAAWRRVAEARPVTVLERRDGCVVGRLGARARGEGASSAPSPRPAATGNDR